MKNIILPLLVLASGLWAADFWQSKPFTDWSDKEAQKIETNSPWSKQVSISAGGAHGPDTGRGKKGGSGGGGDLDSPGVTGSTGARPSSGDFSGGTMGGNNILLTVSWRSALPVRQAVAKTKYGAEAANSPDAKKLMEEEQKYYLIVVSGLPGGSGRWGERMKEAFLKDTTLSVKGKDPIQLADVKSGGNEQNPVVVFLFPRTAPISEDDKDIEFSTKLGPIAVKQKFHLKDMVFNGKLEL
jgi:hypothetical protein